MTLMNVCYTSNVETHLQTQPWKGKRASIMVRRYQAFCGELKLYILQYFSERIGKAAEELPY